MKAIISRASINGHFPNVGTTDRTVVSHYDPELLANEDAAEPVHVLFVLDDNGEANGTVRVYCSIYCREKALQTNEDPVAKGEEPVTEFVGWQCKFCGEELVS